MDRMRDLVQMATKFAVFPREPETGDKGRSLPDPEFQGFQQYIEDGDNRYQFDLITLGAK